MHKSCALYSTLVCPFLKHPSSKRRSLDEDTNRILSDAGLEGINRGTGGLMGFKDYGLVLFKEQAMFDKLPRWGYFNWSESIPYGEWKDRVTLYEQALVDDAEFIDTSTRLYWNENHVDKRQLRDLLIADDKRVGLARFAAPLTYVDGYLGGHGYRLLIPDADA